MEVLNKINFNITFVRRHGKNCFPTVLPKRL